MKFFPTLPTQCQRKLLRPSAGVSAGLLSGYIAFQFELANHDEAQLVGTVADIVKRYSCIPMGTSLLDMEQDWCPTFSHASVVQIS